MTNDEIISLVLNAFNPISAIHTDGAAADTDTVLFVVPDSNNNLVGGKMPASVLRAYLTKALNPTINSSGYWVIGSTVTTIKAEGVTPLIRRGANGIEASTDKGSTYNTVALWSDLRPDFAGMSAEEKAAFKLQFSDLTDAEKSSLKGATGATGPTGPKGDTGNSGVAISASKPSDPNIDVWIDPDGESNTIVVDTISYDESITSPANMSGDVNGSVIKKIRSLHRRCLAKYLGDGKMAICYLQDDNSNFYFDGTEAVLDGTEGDVMVYRPSYSHLFERIDANRFKVSFSLIALGGMWKNVDACLIGAYEAYSVNNKLYSRSGVASAGSISQTNFKTYARARGTGYQIIDYDMHKEIPWLFYALYGTRNCQSVCGSGTDAYDKLTGQTNGIGNTDTTTENGNTMSVNFLGLENCWGNKYEFIDNVIYNPDTNNLGVWKITDIRTGTIREVQGMSPGDAWIWPKKMAAGDDLDIIGTEGGQSDNTGYCDGQYLSTSLTRVVRRSCDSSDSGGGVACAATSVGASEAYAFIGSRLAFRGEIIVYESVAAFKALSVVN